MQPGAWATQPDGPALGRSLTHAAMGTVMSHVAYGPAADASHTSASASDVMHPTAIDGSASTPPSIQVTRHAVISAISVHSNQDRTRAAGCGT